MEFEIGIACGTCDVFNPMGTARCQACGNDLGLLSHGTAKTNPAFRAVRPQQAEEPAPAPPPAPAPISVPPTRLVPPPRAAGSATAQLSSSIPAAIRAAQQAPPAVSRRPPAPDLPLSPPDAAAREASEPRLRVATPGAHVGVKKPPSFAHLSQEELMDQARHYLCWQCYTPVPPGHKFCGRCGSAVPEEILNARTLYFSDMQNPAKARLVLIRGEGMDGLSYHLKMEQHVVGRKGQIPFPDDPFVSPKHANFFYRDGKLVVRDEGSLNGVYLRVRGSVEISSGDTFLAGEQVFRLDASPRFVEHQDAEGTMFYGSPRYPSTFRITQILQGGALGMTVCARGTALQLGREGGDLNFPGDIYMSSSHCRIEENNGTFTLTDLSSRNGTYMRVKSERELGHGDYLFIGRKLMRVELNALALMNRLIFVDNVGGSLAALITAVARVDGAKSFDQVEAYTSGGVNLDPVVGLVLSEIGIQMVPVIEPFDPARSPGDDDVLISLGTAPAPNAHQHWDGSLAPHDAPALVQRSAARIVRDALARHLALFAAQRLVSGPRKPPSACFLPQGALRVASLCSSRPRAQAVDPGKHPQGRALSPLRQDVHAR